MTPPDPFAGGGAGHLKLEPVLQPPPEPISPLSNPTSASLAHCVKRNGCSSCRLACRNAGLMASTAEIGKTHLDSAAGGTQTNYSEESNRSIDSEKRNGVDEVDVRSLRSPRICRQKPRIAEAILHGSGTFSIRLIVRRLDRSRTCSQRLRIAGIRIRNVNMQVAG